MDGPNLIGLTGALIAGYAYILQIKHLTKKQCSAGISRRAYILWLISSLLVTINAIYIESVVFIVLGIIQICSTALIYIYSTRYKNNVCPFHSHLKHVIERPIVYPKPVH